MLASPLRSHQLIVPLRPIICKSVTIMNHIFAVAFAAVVAFLSYAVLSVSGTTLFCVFCFSIFVGYVIYNLLFLPKLVLNRKFAKLGNVIGRTLAEIEQVVGPHSSSQKVHITNMDNAPGFVYTWQRDDYVVSLLFDEHDICLCVDEEKGL